MSSFNPFDQPKIYCTDADVDSIGEPSDHFATVKMRDVYLAESAKEYVEYLLWLRMHVENEWEKES